MIYILGFFRIEKMTTNCCSYLENKMSPIEIKFSMWLSTNNACGFMVVSSNFCGKDFESNPRDF